MEGIFGIINFDENQVATKETLEKMAVPLRAGRCDHFDVLQKEYFCFGISRYCAISSIQKSKVTESDSGRVYVIMQGEIFNYKELKASLPAEYRERCDSDLKLLAALYELYGRDLGKHLNGHYAIALWDKKERELVLLTDFFGSAHPVYWAQVGRQFIFATHLKSLLMYPGMNREIDYQALSLFFKNMYIANPYSIYKNVRKLSPGQMIRFSKRGRTEEKWFDLIAGPVIKDEKTAKARFLELLENSVANRLETDGELGVFLSGGFDTGANVAFAAKNAGRTIKTFTIGFDDQVIDERPYAKIMAERFKTDHYDYKITGREINDLPRLIWSIEEPYVEVGALLSYLGQKIASDKIAVAIGGEGADQLFGTSGFFKARPFTFRHQLEKHPVLNLVKWFTKLNIGKYFPVNDSGLTKMLLYLYFGSDFNTWSLDGFFNHQFNALSRKHKLSSFPVLIDNKPGINRKDPAELYNYMVKNIDVLHYINDNLLVKTYRTANMLGLTYRSPFLDKDLVNFIYSLDLNLKRTGVHGTFKDLIKPGQVSKYLHKQAMQDVLPLEIINKPKQGGFVHPQVFIGDSSRIDVITDYIQRSKVINEYFNRGMVNQLIKNLKNEETKKAPFHSFLSIRYNRVISLLIFDIWHKMFIENMSLATPALSLDEFLASPGE